MKTKEKRDIKRRKSIPNRHGWTKERRRKAAERCRKTKPWKHTTGPKTEAGKNISKLNATKHGGRSADMRELHELLTAYGIYLRGFSARTRRRHDTL